MDFSEPTKFLFLAGDPALDLLNTTPVLASGPVDLLASFGDMVRWMEEAGLATPQEALDLRRPHEPAEGEAALKQAKELREALREVVFAIEKGASSPKRPLAEINTALRQAVGYSQLEWRAQPPSFLNRRHRDCDDVASRTIGPLALSVATLLTARDISLIRKCENPVCVLHYLDTSKNHSRRWCSMDICGNRMKAASHYRRHRGK